MLGNSKAGASQVQRPTAPVPAQAVRFTTPVVETPGIFILTGWLWRFLRLCLLLPVQFPVSVAVVACSVAAYVLTGWVGLAVLWTVVDLGLLVWWRRWPHSFKARVALRALATWRRF
ncbi:cell division protein FtsK, partial [Streptomonospora salina]